MPAKRPMRSNKPGRTRTRGSFMKEKFRKHTQSLINKPPMEHKEQNELANRMFTWIAQTDVHSLEQFAANEHIALSELEELAQTNSYFKRALELCHNVIAHRIQQSWRDKTVEAAYARSILPLYSAKFREFALARFAARDAQAENKNQVHVVELPSYKERKAPKMVNLDKSDSSGYA